MSEGFIATVAEQLVSDADHVQLTVYMVAGSDEATTVPWSFGEDHDRARGDVLAVA